MHKQAYKHIQTSDAYSPKYLAPVLMGHLEYQNRKMLRHNYLLNISRSPDLQSLVTFGW